jgi:hypothetical protein
VRGRFRPGGLETLLRPLHESIRIDNDATVLTFANLPARIEGVDLELVEFAFHAEKGGAALLRLRLQHDLSIG